MIQITQWLCPGRHCSIALLWDQEEDTAEQIEQKGEKMYEGAVRRICGICGSTDIKPETQVTRWATMEEAGPEIEFLRRANENGRKLLGGRF